MGQQPHPHRVRLLPWPLPDPLIDGVLVVFLLVILLVRRLGGPESEASTTIEVAAAVAGIGLVLLRRTRPLVVLAITLGAGVVATAATDQPTLLLLAALIVLYTVATREPWPTALGAGGVSVAVYAALVLAYIEPGRLAGGLLAAMAWPAFAMVAGSAVRQARDGLAQAQERAARAEATRELEARRRVIEERLRIARDVHDLVAHHLAVVAVQSGVAAHMLDADPEAAGTALDTVRSSASTAMSELGELLGVLRDPGDGTGPVDPTPDLGAIDDLITSFSASGLTIEHRISGEPRPLGGTVQVAAYRIIQEALTNAHKHGDGPMVLSQTWGDGVLEIEATNRAGPGRSTTAGYGLIGMRERAEAVGGELTMVEPGPGHHHHDDRFTVRVVLPTREAP